MSLTIPSPIPLEHFKRFILSMADDELVLGHRDSEWTGHAPILEEDIAFSNIAQDEIGHALVWYTMYEELGGPSPDEMGFLREWNDFLCCHFVTYPRGDFAYTVVRQYLYDVAEQVRLRALLSSSVEALRSVAEKLIREESYHLLHSQSLVERLGDATPESHDRMQRAVTEAFPQALGIFEELEGESSLIESGVFVGNTALKSDWLKEVVPVLRKASLHVPVQLDAENVRVLAAADEGGRRGRHLEHLKQLVEDMQQVYRLAPQSQW
jgi:ring-1,2-phenylacetyl-CoA epoxidase subunit PaaC